MPALLVLHRTEAGLTNSLKLGFIPSQGDINGYHEVPITTLHINSCMEKSSLYEYMCINHCKCVFRQAFLPLGTRSHFEIDHRERNKATLQHGGRNKFQEMH